MLASEYQQGNWRSQTLGTLLKNLAKLAVPLANSLISPFDCLERIRPLILVVGSHSVHRY